MIGLGCMRLSTAGDRDDARGIGVIHAALDGGVRLLDSADAYALDDADIGHNERLIARALSSWSGDRSAVTVATKGGLTRPGGAWVPNGRAGHLRRAARESAAALGTGSIDLYQLHAVDPRTPLATSARALAALLDDGVVRQVGLCNVTLTQLKAARKILPVASVQVSMSPFDLTSLKGGIVDYCRDERIQVMAYRPLGGERIRRLLAHRPVVAWSERLAVTGAEVVLAWLAARGVVPLAGATRVATARSLGVAAALRLPDDAVRDLDAEFGWSAPLATVVAGSTPERGEIVIILGMPGAGKSTVVREFEARGYRRLNRDAEGGTLSQLAERLTPEASDGGSRWVLDNTYPTRASRRDVLDRAAQLGLPTRCIWVTTALADAQVNAIQRLIEAHGSLPMPEDIRQRQRRDPRYLGPDALFRFERQFEPPEPDEGFATIEQRAFTRRPGLGARPALFMELDRCLDEGVPLRPEDLRPNAALVRRGRALCANGWGVMVQAWRPQIADGTCATDAMEGVARRVRELLGETAVMAWCPHPAGPPVCWCRKPIPGLHIAYATPNGIDLGRSLVVGPSPADRTVATRLGARYVAPASFADPERTDDVSNAEPP